MVKIPLGLGFRAFEARSSARSSASLLLWKRWASRRPGVVITGEQRAISLPTPQPSAPRYCTLYSARYADASPPHYAILDNTRQICINCENFRNPAHSLLSSIAFLGHSTQLLVPSNCFYSLRARKVNYSLADEIIELKLIVSNFLGRKYIYRSLYLS